MMADFTVVFHDHHDGGQRVMRIAADSPADAWREAWDRLGFGPGQSQRQVRGSLRYQLVHTEHER